MDVNEALMKGNFGLLRERVESGADVNTWDREGRTPLINCCLHEGESWALAAARLLLSYGARVGSWDRDRRNALIHAVLYQREGLVRLYLDALDYDLNHTDRDGYTALWYAGALGHVGITKMIVFSLKRYGLESKKDRQMLPIQACQGHTSFTNMLQNSGNSSQKMSSKSHLGTAGEGEGPAVTSRSRCLPFKPLPKGLWEKRKKFPKSQGPSQPSRQTRDCGGKVTLSLMQKPNLTPHTSKNVPFQEAAQPPAVLDKVTLPTGQPHSLHGQNWRQDLQNLAELLQIQLTPSFCPKAKPFLTKKDHIPQDAGHGAELAVLLHRRRMTQRLSYDAGKDVLKKTSVRRGSSWRRCSVAVIPLTSLQGWKRPVCSAEQVSMERSPKAFSQEKKKAELVQLKGLRSWQE